MTDTRPLNDIERFELVMMMFPDQLNEEENDIGDEEYVIDRELEIAPEDFDLLVGRLMAVAPVMESPLTGHKHHVLGVTDFEAGSFIAAVKREVSQAEERSDNHGV